MLPDYDEKSYSESSSEDLNLRKISQIFGEHKSSIVFLRIKAFEFWN